MSFLKAFLHSLSDALFPAVCEVCRRPLTEGEDVICLECLVKMPRTNFHRLDTSDLHLRLADPTLPIEKAAAWFHYVRENPYARLIQTAKYNSRPDLARALGRGCAREIAAEGFFDSIDMLLPVPLHWLKRAKRGYNQSEEICKGINAVTGIPIADNLRMRRHSTQTRLGAADRYANLRGMVTVKHPDELLGQRLLVVDDVITSGATMRSILAAIHEAAPTARLNVLSMGATHLR